VSEPLRDALLTERDLTEIERAHPQGLSSAQIIGICQARGLRLSEATFRKYVQLGLLPRSRRVGSKGKHRGSHGVYPCATVRRINGIKHLMAQSLTIEQIQSRLAGFKQRIESVETALDELLEAFERELIRPQLDLSVRREVSRDVHAVRRTAADLMRQLIQIEGRVTLTDQQGHGPQTGAFAER
jgi:DNA-binding transcriptional MerR regulator